MLSHKPFRLLRRSSIAGWVVVAAVGAGAHSAPAQDASDQARAEGIGAPPTNPGLTAAQRRLMARRAAETVSARNATLKAMGAPLPEEIRDGVIELDGRVSVSKVLESRELPDGRWRAVVEVQLQEPTSSPAPPTRAEVVVTDYLMLRDALERSREACLAEIERLRRETAAATQALENVVVTDLETARADLKIIDRALEDLETKTILRLSPTTTASAPTR